MRALCVPYLAVLLAASTVRAQSIRVSPSPSVRIGATDESSALLNAIAGATRLPNGHIVVGNRGDYALLVFDATGALVKKAARKGQGPGEIESLIFLLRCGEALYTLDGNGQRVQEYAPSLSYQRAFRFKQLPYRQACNARGQFVHMGWEENNAMKPGANRSLARYWITPSDSSAGVTLGELPGSERFGYSPRLLGREPRVAIGADAAYVALADSLHVLVFGLDGRPRAPLSAPFTQVAPTRADVDAERERWIAMLGEGARKGIDAMLSGQELPKTLPATRDLYVDATGLIWVQSYPSARHPTVTWTVFRPNGTVAARLSLPTALDVFEIGRDYLLGQVLNPDTGVPEIHLYPITR